MREIYRERPLGKIALALERQRGENRPASAPRRAEAPLARRLACGTAQAVAAPFFVLLHIADWLAPFFVYHYFTGDPGDSIARAVLYSLGTFVLAQWGNFAVAVCGKRVLAGRLKAGRYPLWGVGLFSLVAGEQVLRAAGCPSAGRHAVDAALPASAGGAHRARM